MSRTLKLKSYLLIVILSVTNADILKCTPEMDENACTNALMDQMDHEMREIHIEVMRNALSKIKEATSALMSQLSADDKHLVVMKIAVDTIEDDIKVRDKMMEMTDDIKMQEMVEKFVTDIIPDFADAESLIDMSEKHCIIVQMFAHAIMAGFEASWPEFYSGLREKDLKKYPLFTTMNDKMMSIREMNDSERAKIIIETMTTIIDFHKTPYIRAMVTLMCHHC